MNAVAVVLASGSGQRFVEKTKPKHLTHILGVPILVWTLDTIIKSKLFSTITVVAKKDDMFQTENIIKEYFSDDMLSILLTEGSNIARIQSFLFGLENLMKANLIKGETIVALFDANRPFTPIDQLIHLYESSLEFDCSCPTRPVVNGVARIDLDRIIKVPDKSNFVEFVTPEFMRFAILEESLGQYKESFNSLVEYALALGVKPMTVEASALNTKLTYPEDKTFLDGLALDNKLVKPIKYKSVNKDSD